MKNNVFGKFQGFKAYRLGATFGDRALLVIYYFLIRLNRKLGKSYFKKTRSVALTYKHITFQYLITNLDDYRLLEEIFINTQYHIETGELTQTIVDLGSNVGTSIVYFLAEHPSAHIYGFEPTTYCFDRLMSTVGKHPSVTLEKKAVGITDGEIASIYIHPQGHSGSSNFFIDGSTKEEVPVISLDSIIQKHSLTSIDILKVDIEGYEYEVFKHFKNLHLVKYIMVEIHPFLSGYSQDDFLALLPGFKITTILQNPYSGKTVQINLIRI